MHVFKMCMHIPHTRLTQAKFQNNAQHVTDKHCLLLLGGEHSN